MTLFQKTFEKTRDFLRGWSNNYGGDAIDLDDLVDELELLKEEIDTIIDGIREEEDEESERVILN